MKICQESDNEAIRAKLDSGEIPPGVTGLIPDGNTKLAGVGWVKSLKKALTTF